ncbi:family 16 glycoside hydrolase [uncultured Kriegella sp.]|uniref:family 16 glycoside hydrolase n=1 Tax=uncultured Kriegella sp. TaxID=1798910 RepID=UPI0030D89CA2|tara:strand:- start:237152 stop:239038 length:1887 start_codon:yes stop_codon:yes gene_type:complete
MNYSKYPICLLLLSIVVSCTEKASEVKETSEEQPMQLLPFTTLELNDMSGFKKTTDNWQIVGSAYADRNKEQTMTGADGTGVLINLPDDAKKDHLFTDFEHGDIELELDVMMPVNSNSGLYFQGRYEVQLFDSWGKKEPEYSDIGGIYQGDDKEGRKGFEGQAPRVNAAKTPGLWQHFKIIFHAPKFDSNGKKTKNAWFEEVRLNGELLHENLEVTGPTRAAAFTDEKPMGPFMIQGDHGPVAIKNIRYKLYQDKKVSLVGVKMAEYENESKTFPNIDSLTPIRVVTTDSISSLMATGERPQKLLVYTGELSVPEDGDYLFDFKLSQAGGALLIDNDTLISLNGNYNLDDPGFATISLKKGNVPFKLLYNKHNRWARGLKLAVEGPGLQKQSLTAVGSIDFNRGKPAREIMVEVGDEPITQRGFVMHEGKKRTHVISVGMPEGIHFAYDLAFGSLIKAWDGSFLNTTQMWHSRGIEQLAVPAAFNVSVHGDPDFEFLKDDLTVWPDTIPVNVVQKQLGYEFDAQGVPTFSHEINGTVITDRFVPVKTNRGLKRTTTISGEEEIWHKIADGSKIEALPDDTYIISDENYFVDFSGNDNLEPIIRHVNGKDELLVKIDAGEDTINYSIIW